MYVLVLYKIITFNNYVANPREIHLVSHTRQTVLCESGRYQPPTYLPEETALYRVKPLENLDSTYTATPSLS